MADEKDVNVTEDNNSTTKKEKKVMSLKITDEELKALSLKMMGNQIVSIHSQEELDQVRAKGNAKSVMMGITGNADMGEDLSYEALMSKANGIKKEPAKSPIHDFTVIGKDPEKDPCINTVLQKKFNQNAQTTVAGEVVRDAAHLSVNIQTAADSGEFALRDKEIRKDLGPLFEHKTADVKDDAIITFVNPGQMESTSILLNDHEEIDRLAATVNNVANYYAYKSALRIASKIDKNEVKRDAENLLILINKGAIRNEIDARILANMSPEMREDSTKADREDTVTAYMKVLNGRLKTYSTERYVATIELQNWTYAIFALDASKASNYANHSKKRGRKYFDLGNNYILKIDMKGAKAGSKVPVSPDDIEDLKNILGIIQHAFLVASENQIRKNIGLDLIEMPKIEVLDLKADEIDKDAYLIKTIFEKAGIKDSVSDFIDGVNSKVTQEIDYIMQEALAYQAVDKI